MYSIEDGDYNYQEIYKEILQARDNLRPYEEIVAGIQKELKDVREESFLIHSMRLFMELNIRSYSPLYEHLHSPMRQTLYLIDIYYSIKNRSESLEMDEKRWKRIALLLNEMEVTYFVNIGFPNEGDVFNDERDAKVEVSLATFLVYFSNAVLSYEEQTRDRIERCFRPYDNYIRKNYGFTVDEALTFIAHLREINNDKLNEITKPYMDTTAFYHNHPKEWKELRKKFIERGLIDERMWWFQPELSGILKTMMTSPGEVSIHNAEEIMKVGLAQDSLHHIIDFFTYNKDKMEGKTIYYADKHYSESYPLIKFEDKYCCPLNKFFFEGLFYRIDDVLAHDSKIGVDYKQRKDKALEIKTLEVFKQFFTEKTKIFTHYSVDAVAENDMLILFGDTCIVVEIKDCGFREPFRDPIRAFDRIKKDFENAIQTGYNQCKRVEDILLSGKDVTILDAGDMKKVLYKLKSQDIGDIWLVVVTDFKYGPIQTALKALLKKNDGDLYPWSVCIDDLEDMLLLMRKMMKGIAPYRFVEFLDYRERFQEHIMCYDELELCGWYLNDREQFKKCADNDANVNTVPNMGTIFDAYYQVGLGFKNELDIEYKRQNKLPDYPKKFEIYEMTGGGI